MFAYALYQFSLFLATYCAWRCTPDKLHMTELTISPHNDSDANLEPLLGLWELSQPMQISRGSSQWTRQVYSFGTMAPGPLCHPLVDRIAPNAVLQARGHPMGAFINSKYQSFMSRKANKLTNITRPLVSNFH